MRANARRFDLERRRKLSDEVERDSVVRRWADRRWYPGKHRQGSPMDVPGRHQPRPRMSAQNRCECIGVAQVLHVYMADPRHEWRVVQEQQSRACG